MKESVSQYLLHKLEMVGKGEHVLTATTIAGLIETGDECFDNPKPGGRKTEVTNPADEKGFNIC
jgi:hypothetical protein